jgi:putative protein-disulfide isomerase
MILAIQQAYYLQARNPSDSTTLIALASELGLHKQQFTEQLNWPSTQQKLDIEMTDAHRMGVRSFPSLVLQVAEDHWPVVVDYHRAEPMLAFIQTILESTQQG